MEMPVLLIQALHERERDVHVQLDAIARLVATQRQLEAELAQLEAMLAVYGLPAPTPETSPAQTEVDRELPSVVPAYVGPSDSPDAWSLSSSLIQLLADVGPASAAYLQRQVRQVYGREVPHATIYDALKRGQAAGVLTQKQKLWRLTSGAQVEAQE